MVLFFLACENHYLGWGEHWKSWNVACKRFRNVVFIGNEPFTCIKCTYITICASLINNSMLVWTLVCASNLSQHWGGGGGNGSLPTLNRGGGGISYTFTIKWCGISQNKELHTGFVHCLQIIFVCFHMPNCRLLQTMQLRFFPLRFWPG